jgi:uncharacterized membrane protein
MTKKDNKNFIIGIVVVIAILILLEFFGFGFRSYGMMSGYSYGFMSLGWIFSILVIILIIVGIYWLIKNIDYNKRRK